MESNDSDDGALPTMSTISRHNFGDNPEKPDLCISVIENMKEDYGLFVWPCSIVLAEYIWQQRQRFAGTNVVELGAGTSLPGLVAAKVGAGVTLTDDSSRLEVLDNMRKVCDLNKLKCNVLGLTWGVWDSSIFNLQAKVILGADVLYESNAFDDLFATVTFLLQKSPGSVFITTYHNRSGHHLIEFLMVKWGLKCVKLLDGFSFLPPCKASMLSDGAKMLPYLECSSIAIVSISELLKYMLGLFWYPIESYYTFNFAKLAEMSAHLDLYYCQMAPNLLIICEGNFNNSFLQ